MSFVSKSFDTITADAFEFAKRFEYLLLDKNVIEFFCAFSIVEILSIKIELSPTTTQLECSANSFNV